MSTHRTSPFGFRNIATPPASPKRCPQRILDSMEPGWNSHHFGQFFGRDSWIFDYPGTPGYRKVFTLPDGESHTQDVQPPAEPACFKSWRTIAKRQPPFQIEDIADDPDTANTAIRCLQWIASCEPGWNHVSTPPRSWSKVLVWVGGKPVLAQYKSGGPDESGEFCLLDTHPRRPLPVKWWMPLPPPPDRGRE